MAKSIAVNVTAVDKQPDGEVFLRVRVSAEEAAGLTKQEMLGRAALTFWRAA